MLASGLTNAQDRTVFFDVDAVGEKKAIDLWGLDTAWLDAGNVIRGVEFMGKPQVDVIRFSFTGDAPLGDSDGNGVFDSFTGTALSEFNERMRIVDTYTGPDTVLYLNNDTTGGYDPYFWDGDSVHADHWAELIALTAKKASEAGRTVVSVAPFNEPDCPCSFQGTVSRFGEVAASLRANFPMFDYGAENFIRIMGGNTLNNDLAGSWYLPLNNAGWLEEGNTHQLAGNMSTYIEFFEYVEAVGDVGTNDELHNVMEAMVGAEYGMDVGIWWGTAEYARGEFVKTSDGVRLGYAEHRPNWTAASVYRSLEGKVQAFVGESERQTLPTSYMFVSKDRDVYFDGVGPQRTLTVRTTGGSGYQTEAHRNAEKVVNITWGEDIQPVIDGRYTLVNRASQKVMEVESGSSENGANIQQGDPAYTTNQSWLVKPVPSTIGGDWSYFTLKPFHNTLKTADVWNWNINAGADVRQYDYAGGSNQQWILEYVENGYFTIRTRFSGKYLEVAGGSSVAGANIQLGEHSGDPAQQWRLVPAGASVEFEAPLAPEGLKLTANAASIRLLWDEVAVDDLKGYHVYRSKNPDSGYDLIARYVLESSYVDKDAKHAGVEYFYKVKAVDESLNLSEDSGVVSGVPEGGRDRIVALSFEQDTLDSSGNGNHAFGSDMAGFVDGKVGESSLYFNGATFHTSLPAALLDSDALTIATWVYWSGNTDEQSVFDFSDGDRSYLRLTPRSDEGSLSFSLQHGEIEETLIATALTAKEWTHVAVSLDGTEGRLFVNGVLAESKEMSVKPSDLGTVLNYLGKSAGDRGPMFAGRLDRFEVYNFGIDADAALSLAGTTVPASPRDVVGEFDADAILLRWSAVPGAQSYTVKRSTRSGGAYETVATGVLESRYLDTDLGGEDRFYYLIEPSNEVGAGTASSEIMVLAADRAEEWRIMHFGSAENTGSGADLADPDGDGIVNLLERAFGGDPLHPDVEVLPQAGSSGPELSILYRISEDAIDLQFEVVESLDLASDWIESDGDSETVSEEAGVETRRFTRAIDGESSVFLRVRVSQE